MEKLLEKKGDIHKAKVIALLSLVLLVTFGLLARAEDPDYGDECTLAEPIDPNGTIVEGVLGDTGDQDWFSFTASADSRCRIMLYSQSGRKYLELFGPDECTQQVLSFNAYSGSVTTEVFVESPGTYYLKIYGGSGLYRVSVDELGAYPTDTYPNICPDANAGALVVDGGPVYDGITDSGMDEDWFTFPTSAHHKYEVSFYRPLNSDVAYGLYDDSCDSLYSGTSNMTFVSLYGNNHNIRVHSSSFVKEGYYQIWVQDVGEQAHDHSNTCDAATAINTTGDFAEGRLTYAATVNTDEDWFSFAASANALYEISLYTQSGRKYLAVFGSNECAQQIASFYTDTGSVTKDVFILSAGTYYIRVYAGTGLYRVSVNEVGTYPDDTYPNTCLDPCELIVDGPSAYDGITNWGMDEDWFTFATITLHKYRINLFQPINTDVGVALHQIDCKDQLYGGASFTLVSLADTNYDLRLYSRSFAKEGYYEIWVEDLGEQHDDHGYSYDTATPIGANGARVNGALDQYSANVGGDGEDWLSFTTAAEGLYAITLYGSLCGWMGMGPPTKLTLYSLDDSKQLQLITSFTSGGEEVLLEGWTVYYLKVSDCGPYGVSVLAPEPQCGDPTHPYPSLDLNQDCVVNLLDVAMLAGHWLEDNRP